MKVNNAPIRQLFQTKLKLFLYRPLFFVLELFVKKLPYHGIIPPNKMFKM